MQHLQPNTTLQGGKYRIQRVLGQGGFGITYEGYNTMLESKVAIKEMFIDGVTHRDDEGMAVGVSNEDCKMLFSQQLEKFKKEARRQFDIKNDHVVKVYDLFEENGTAYYVMEFIEGENLKAYLNRTGKPIPKSMVIDKILPQLLDALDAVHHKNLWHLDIKPSNIMLETKTGRVVLIDFGASKQLNHEKGGATTETAVCYTRGYAPLEQMDQNYKQFGPWTDIYALGATMFNILTNMEPPLPSELDDDTTEEKVNALPLPSESYEEVRDLLLFMMQTKRANRPKNVTVLRKFIGDNFQKDSTKSFLDVVIIYCTMLYSKIKIILEKVGYMLKKITGKESQTGILEKSSINRYCTVVKSSCTKLYSKIIRILRKGRDSIGLKVLLYVICIAGIISVAIFAFNNFVKDDPLPPPPIKIDSLPPPTPDYSSRLKEIDETLRMANVTFEYVKQAYSDYEKMSLDDSSDKNITAICNRIEDYNRVVRLIESDEYYRLFDFLDGIKSDKGNRAHVWYVHKKMIEKYRGHKAKFDKDYSSFASFKDIAKKSKK